MTRRNEELSAAAALWQYRAMQAEERLAQLEAGPIAGGVDQVAQDKPQERTVAPVRDDQPARASGDPYRSSTALAGAVTAVAGEVMAKRKRDRLNDWMWRPADEPQILPTGEVVVREPREGWSPAFYEAVLQHYFVVRGAYPRTARMHPSTALAVASAERAAPVWWPVYDIRRHYAPARIVLSEDEPQMPEP